MQEKITMLEKLITGIRWICSPRYRRLILFRGYRQLQNLGQTHLVQKCKYQISNVPTAVTMETASPNIFFAARHEADLVIRQYLTKRTGDKSISLSIYNAVGGGVPIHHLPPQTYHILRQNGISVWEFGSRVIWAISLLIYWLYGCFMFAKLGRTTARKNSESNSGATAFFQDLPVNAVPDKRTPFQRHDIVSWYARWDKRNPLVQTISHQYKGRLNSLENGINLENRYAGWSGYMSASSRLEYISWGIWTALIALIDLLRGRWWHALMFSQSVMAKRLNLSPKESLPAEIWFNHQNYNYQPIWVYEAEARGIKSYLYFYSINNQTVQPADHEISISCYWHLMNWPRNVIWTSQQKEMLEQYSDGETEYILADHIPYTDGNTELPDISPQAIAVFDIPCYTNRFLLNGGQAYKYQKDWVARAFYEDILDAARASGLMVYAKQKGGRKKSHLSPGYLRLLDKLNSVKGIQGIDADIAPHRLILATDLTISTPYSSTSAIAVALGKPGCFYDPTGLLPEETIFNHGIKVIRSPEALTNWIKSNITSTSSPA